MNRLRDDRLVRNNAIYLTGSVGAGAFGYVFHFVTGRLLGPAGYAVVASAIAALYLLTLPGLAVQLVGARFSSIAAAHDDPGQVRRLVVRLTGLNLVLGGAGAVLIVLLAPLLERYLQIANPGLVYALAAATLLGLLTAANRGVLQGLQRFAALSGNLLIDMVTRVLAAAGLIALGFGPLGGVLAVACGPALAYLQSLFLLRRLRGAAAEEGATVAEVARYALPAAIAVIGVTYLFNIDVVLAKHFLPAEQAGIYAAGSVLARVVYFLGLTIAGVMFPEVANLHARNLAHFHVVEVSLLFLVLIGAALCLTYLVLPGLVLFPYGAGFEPVRPYLAPFAAALSLLAVANLLVNYFLSVASRRFIPPLLGACVLETALILAFHGAAGQVLAMVAITTGALTLTLGAVYLLERLRGGATAAL